ncbi:MULTISPECIES: DUF2059 domain-containing protein [Dyella]|uniref:DUF2059 domain-containing protein n=2 Tax=Dyella TaxID=231454 RepID=A0A4R0YWK1_9GAMM|nr:MULTISPECIES: DUF2059 domain-containing protein [Dyella]TBR39484.1 DUF2059 domain-containing protein [Dyella terrae]TCI12931.1 DUF2059 domain-containing protein [Dyella soli]
MKVRFALVMSLALIALPAWSADAPPSDASIHKLMEVTQAQKMSENIMAQMREVMLRSAKQALGNGNGDLDPKEQEIVTRSVTQLTDLLTKQVAWKELEPSLTDIYKKTFTQKEVDDLTAFYLTPSGKAVIEKMPLVVQQSMAMGESKVKGIVPQLQQINENMVKELTAYRKSKDASKQG